MQFDAVIVGGGLFGSTIAQELRSQGRRVEVLDRGEPLAGSGPAACLMKPSWFAGLGEEVYKPALETLDQLYGVRDLPFAVHVGARIATQTVHWVNPRHVLTHDKRHCSVVSVAAGRVGLSNGETIEARHVIVAAGVWTETLLRQYAQGWQRGMAVLYPEARAMGVREEGVIKPWAPYRQLVGFDRGDGVWVGDGSAIRHDNWSAAREEQILARERKLARRLIGPTLPLEAQLQGLRPYWKGGRPCLLEQVEPGLWVASGGAKNGTLAAGWSAWRLGRELS
jgi:glycine/D-amino acid oxidase-like deaminating enzyme